MAFDGMETIFTKNNFSVLRVGFANFKLKIETLKIGVKTLDCFNFGLFICHFFVSLCQHLLAIQARPRLSTTGKVLIIFGTQPDRQGKKHRYILPFRVGKFNTHLFPSFAEEPA